jgi:uncharacterized protein (TIGR01732 family)
MCPNHSKKAAIRYCKGNWEGNRMGGFAGAGFALIVVLFILLIIVGAGYGWY